MSPAERHSLRHGTGAWRRGPQGGFVFAGAVRWPRGSAPRPCRPPRRCRRRCCRSIDKPLIQYAVDEAIEAGCDTMVFVTNRYKHAVADYFDKAYELEQQAAERAASTNCSRTVRTSCRADRAVFVTPGRSARARPRGAVREAVVGDEPFAVMLPRRPDLEPRPRRARADGRPRAGHRCFSVLAVQNVPPDKTGSYGIVATEVSPGREERSRASSRSPSPRMRRARSRWSAATCSMAASSPAVEQ